MPIKEIRHMSTCNSETTAVIVHLSVHLARGLVGTYPDVVLYLAVVHQSKKSLEGTAVEYLAFFVVEVLPAIDLLTVR